MTRYCTAPLLHRCLKSQHLRLPLFVNLALRISLALFLFIMPCASSNSPCVDLVSDPPSQSVSLLQYCPILGYVACGQSAQRSVNSARHISSPKCRCMFIVFEETSFFETMNSNMHATLLCHACSASVLCGQHMQLKEATLSHLGVHQISCAYQRFRLHETLCIVSPSSLTYLRLSVL